MSLYLMGQRRELPYERVHEVRTTLELEVACLAAQRAGEGEVARLRATHERLAAVADDVEEASRVDVAFHRGLAEMTHNPLYVVMLDSIADVLLEVRRATMGNRKDVANGCAEHGRILSAIARHDPEAAAEAMRRHLAHALREWKTRGMVRLEGPQEETLQVGQRW
jgi:DNA-binding FadR family transcriptional regulator